MSMRLFVVPQEEAADVVGEQVSEDYLKFHWNAFLTETFYFELHNMSLIKRDFKEFSKSETAIKLARLLSLFMSLHSSAAGSRIPS